MPKIKIKLFMSTSEPAVHVWCYIFPNPSTSHIVLIKTINYTTIEILQVFRYKTEYHQDKLTLQRLFLSMTLKISRPTWSIFSFRPLYNESEYPLVLAAALMTFLRIWVRILKWFGPTAAVLLPYISMLYFCLRVRLG